MSVAGYRIRLLNKKKG
jgi:hypothetical protein